MHRRTRPMRSPKPRPSEKDLHDLDRDAVIDFANEESFGYVKDLRHVAGFLSHRSSEVPRPRRNWSDATVELVGLPIRSQRRTCWRIYPGWMQGSRQRQSS